MLRITVHEYLERRLRVLKQKKTYVKLLWDTIIAEEKQELRGRIRLSKSHGHLASADKDQNLPIILHTPSVTGKKLRKLLILDLDGVLWERTRKQVALSIGVYEFLSACYKEAEVAYFTSSTMENVEGALRKLLTDEQLRATVFVWDRAHTVPFRTPKTPWGTAKTISSVLEEFPQYKGHHIIFADDSPTKMILNPLENVVIYRQVETLEELLVKIKRRFTKMDQQEARHPSQRLAFRIQQARTASSSPTLLRHL